MTLLSRTAACLLALLGLLYVAGGVYAFIAIQSTTIVLAFSSP